jgi:fructose-1,6-bisphosphatase/inositol monophosphatase family enzyme
MSRDWNYLKDIAIEAARAAGAIIRQKLAEEIAVEYKDTGSSYATQVVTAVDKAAESVILKHLQPTCTPYNLALLSEEEEDDGQRLVKDYFWCIDPLDGTLAFIEKRPDFAVSIGLVSKAGQPIIGVVYDPSRDILYHAIAGEGAFKNAKPWQLGEPQGHLSYISDHPLEKAVGKEKIKEIIEQKAAELGLEEVKISTGGGLVINAMRTAQNRPAFMLKLPKQSPGGGSLWDYAATACICQELGLAVTNFTGGKLDLNRKDGTFMNHEGAFYANF